MSDDIVNNVPFDIRLTGDLVLDVPDAVHWLSGIAPDIRAAGLAIGHLEVPHTARGEEMEGDVPAPGADPANLAALADAGFDAVTLAGNHMADCGAIGIADTRAELDRLGIKSCGAGANLIEARAPVLLDAGGRTMALLSYNCVGPEDGWAAADQAGYAYLPIATEDGSPVRPIAPLTEMTQHARDILTFDIARARSTADLVIVAMHKGIVHVPARLAPYERPIAHAAIEAGADVVVGHHAHILRGIEFHRGKPIFHGLGNGCVVTHALSPGQDHAARAAWVERRKALFGFEPDPAYTLAPFHPEAVNAMIAQLLWAKDGGIEVRIIPVHVEAPGRPVRVHGEAARAVADYVERITVAAGLPAIRIDEQFRVAA